MTAITPGRPIPWLLISHATLWKSEKLRLRNFSMLYPDSEGTKNRRAENVRTELFRLFENGRGQNIQETKLTTWVAFNAVTE